MSIYGDLSKPQRKLLHDLFWGPAGSAVSIDTAVSSSYNPRLLDALESKGLVRCRHQGITPLDRHYSVWLTERGLEVMRGLDFRHIGGSRQRSR